MELDGTPTAKACILGIGLRRFDPSPDAKGDPDLNDAADADPNTDVAPPGCAGAPGLNPEDESDLNEKPDADSE